MPLSDTYRPGFLENIPFKIVRDHFVYLGLTIPKDPKLLYKLNFVEFLSKLKGKLKVLPLSMIGRINSIKMVSLPRFLYICQNIQICLTLASFKELDSIILSHVWNYKSHRIFKIKLQKPGSVGGLGLPVFKHYYWAANVRALMYWEKGTLDNRSPEVPLWVQMETGLVVGTSLAAMLFSKVDNPTAINKLSIVLKNSIKILNQVRKVLSLPETSVYTPICYNNSFSPPWSDRTYFIWKEKGLCSIKDLYVEGRFASFNQLREKFDLPHSHFFGIYKSGIM